MFGMLFFIFILAFISLAVFLFFLLRPQKPEVVKEDPLNPTLIDPILPSERARQNEH